MPDSLLRILNVCLLALLLLFFVRVLRAVWVQVNAPPLAVPPQPVPASSGPPVARAVPAGPPGGLRLKVVDPPEQRGRTYDPGDEVTVGRAGGCGIPLADAAVSQLHARLFRRDQALYVEDLGSTNGTWVNRTRVTAPVSLRRGDRVQFGTTVLEVSR